MSVILFFASYIELANHAHLFAIMELACACLDTEEDPFPGQRQYIVQCFQDVKTQQEQIGSLVEQASALLNAILQEEGVDYVKGRQFDNIVREARVQIESCRRRLNGAEQAISELSQKMSTVKWARGMRATGMGLILYTRKNLTACRKSANKLCSHCLSQVVNKYEKSY
jgi:hypothetical protein